MHKKTILLVIITIIIAAVIYVGPIVYYFHDDGVHKFKIAENGNIEISKGDVTIESQKSYYDEATGTYYIIGVLTNHKKESIDYVSLNFLLYDQEHNVLGEASSYLDHLNGNTSWKFKATYQEFDAASIETYQFDSVAFY